MAEIERELVKKSFGNHAGQYDSLAKVQKKVTDRFAELLATGITPPLEKAFAEVHRTLKPSGRFCFALFGEKTLCELKESLNCASRESDRPAADRTHRFATAAEVLSAMTAAGFSGSRVHEEMEVEIHPDVATLLRSLKGIGAGSAARRGDSGLSGRSAMLRMMEIYREKYGTNEGVQASYHVLYGYGEKF